MTTPTDPEVAADELHGWIQPCDPKTTPLEAQRELEALGVDVGVWDSHTSEFKYCIVSRDAMDKLDPLWGRFIWGLQ